MHYWWRSIHLHDVCHYLEETQVTCVAPIHHHFSCLGRSSSQPLDMYCKCLVTLAGKTIHVDIKVIDAPLNYNILLGRSYIYAMLAIASAVFRKMCFPHEGKIVTIDQLTYYEPSSLTSPKSIISSMSDKYYSTPLTSVSPKVYKDSSLLGSFPGPPPPNFKPSSLSVCMLQVSWAA